MEELRALFEEAEANGGMTKEIQLKIFHYYARDKSCIPLCGTNAEEPKKPIDGFFGYQRGSVEWLELKNFNIDMMGLCTGVYNNLIVLDVDNVEIFQKVVDYFNLSLPETTLMKSGRGFHHYFSYPNDVKTYLSRAFHYLGFDILASSRYVVAPGSLHPNGSYYKPVRLLEENILPPKWLKLLSTKDGEFNFILSEINKIGISEANKAKKLGLPEPEFDIDKLVARMINDNPQYENFMHQFLGYNKYLENSMAQTNNNPHPFEQTQNTSIELSEPTKNELNYNPPIGQRSEPIMSAILSLKNAGFSDEQVRQIMLSSPLGTKLSEKGELFTSYEIASANSFIQANPPKKPKIDIAAEAYAYMQQFHYVRVGERELYCKVIHSPAVIEYIDVKSDSFQGIICKYLLTNFKKIIPAVQFKPLLAALIEEKRFTAPIIPSISRFYSDDSKIIYDLGRDDYQCIEITANCVRQIPHPEMILERSNFTIPVSVENSLDKSGNIALLWDLCDIRNDYERHFLNIVVLSYLFNNISSPILYFYGSHGSGKTSLALAIKNIFDPAEEGTVLPSRDSALRLFLNKSGIGLIDNFSKLNSEFQNDLCSSYSGGKTIERELYSNKGTVQYSIKCPVILTSINVPTKLQPDFISRTVFFKVNPKQSRRSEVELKKKLLSFYPAIRSEMFNLASQILPIKNNYNPTNLTRHADLDQIGQAYCDICKTSISYVDICRQVNINSTFAVFDDEPSIRKFIEFIFEQKFITFTPSELSKILYDKYNLNIDRAQLGRNLNFYTSILKEFHISVYVGDKLYSGAIPYVAFLDDEKSIPYDIDVNKLIVSTKYVIEIYCRYHKTELSYIIDDMIENL